MLDCSVGSLIAPTTEEAWPQSRCPRHALLESVTLRVLGAPAWPSWHWMFSPWMVSQSHTGLAQLAQPPPTSTKLAVFPQAQPCTLPQITRGGRGEGWFPL